MPCPQGIHIPDTFTMYNDLVDPETAEKAKAKYANAIKEGVDASICAQCGACEAVCPQAINIIDVLKEADAALRDVYKRQHYRFFHGQHAHGGI